MQYSRDLRHHDIPLTSVEMTDTALLQEMSLFHLLPFAKVGQLAKISELGVQKYTFGPWGELGVQLLFIPLH